MEAVSFGVPDQQDTHYLILVMYYTGNCPIFSIAKGLDGVFSIGN